MSGIDFFLKNEPDSQELAEKLAKICSAGDALLLYGEVGAGKTTFARAFIKHFASNEEVTSPTFTIVQDYIGQAGEKIYHCDLYRLKHENDLEELGLWEVLEHSITLVEWPVLIEKKLPAALKIHLEISGAGRMAKLLGNERWQERLKNL